MNISMEDYLKIPAISNSDLKQIKKSMAHYLHYKSLTEEERETTPAQALGIAGHTLLFEPHNFENRFVVTPSDNWRLKENTEVRDKAETAGKLAIKPSDRDASMEMVEAVRKHPIAGKMVDLSGNYEAECTVTFKYNPNDYAPEFDCRARFDYINHDKEYFLDLKTIEDCSTTHKVINAIMTYEYYRQMGFYSLAAYLAYGKFYEGRIIFVEKKAPYGIKIFKLDDSLYQYAIKEIDLLLARLHEYEQDKEAWIGYPLEFETAYLPSYLMNEIENN